ncbi:sulfotransferase [Puniceicoccaceae bacterium K14]|nr:sulfotransferase [Puniceicoccaceae bacterium K14]
MKPEFICIGAQKAGTTWLFSRLSSHPEFSMLPIKEIHYFDRSRTYPSPSILSETKLIKRLRNRKYTLEATKEVIQCLKSSNFSRARWWARYYFKNYSDAWYQSLFKNETGITGDITPSYSILNEEDVARMHSVAPDAKILFLMRNPIDRAWSLYRYLEKFGNTIDLNNFDAFKEFVDCPGQELRSNYFRTIDLFLRYYDSSQMLLGYYDAIIKQPDALLSVILKHFGAKDSNNHVDLHQINNKSRQVEMPNEYREYLEHKYRNDLEELARRYGGYPAKWLSGLSCERGGQAADGANSLPPVTHL